MAKKKIKETKVKEEIVVEKVESVEPLVTQQEEPKETVTITLSDLDSFKKEIAEIKRQNAMLLEVADKGRVNNYFDRHKADNRSIVRVRTIDGKIITSWDNMARNDVYRDAQTLAWKEDQSVSINFEDGTKEVYGLLDFNRRFNYLYYYVVGREKQDDGTDKYSLVSKVGGKELIINSKFVN